MRARRIPGAMALMRGRSMMSMNEPPTGRVCGMFSVPESTCLANFNDAYASGTAPTDTDSDGMPNSYETANGLNPE